MVHGPSDGVGLGQEVTCHVVDQDELQRGRDCPV